MNSYTLPGVHQLLGRLGWNFTKGRLSLHSPDPDYIAKRDHVREVVKEVSARADEEVVYVDGVSVEYGPHLGPDWSPVGDTEPAVEAERLVKGRRTWMGALEPNRGEVITLSLARANRKGILRFFKRVRQAYRKAKRVWLVVDNHPVHFHPQVLAALEEQLWPWSYHTPPSWPTFDPATRVDDPLPIQLVPLPTYSPWLNPIEKLWRLLKQDLLLNNPWADKPKILCAEVQDFLDQFRNGSEELLRYVGLLPN